MDTQPRIWTDRELAYRERVFDVPYAPRAMRLSHNEKEIFVGTKGGALLVFADDGDDEWTISPNGVGGEGIGIRSVCDCSGGWIILGRENGTLELQQTHKTSAARPVFTPPIDERREETEDDSVTLISWLDETHLLVSRRSSGSVIHRLQGTSTSPSFDVQPSDLTELRGLLIETNLRPSQGSEAGHWLMLSELGDVWTLRRERLAREDDVWQDMPAPALVTDACRVCDRVPTTPGSSRSGPLAAGVVLTTEKHLHRISLEHDQLRARPVPIPLSARLWVGVTHAQMGNREYLWLADIDRNTSLLCRDAGSQRADGPDAWRRVHLKREDDQFVRMLGSRNPRDDRFMVAYATRKDQVIVGRYESTTHVDEGPSATSILRSGRVESFRTWADETAHERRCGPKRSVASDFADLIEELGNEPRGDGGLLSFLGNPDARLSCAVLAALPETDRPHALEAWVHSFMQSICRRWNPLHQVDEVQQSFLGVIRWLRELRGELMDTSGHSDPGGATLAVGDRAGDARLQVKLEELARYVRKWGLFGGSYRRRANVLRAQRTLLSVTGDRALDNLVYRSKLFRHGVNIDAAFEPPQPESSKERPREVRCHGPYAAVSTTKGSLHLWREGDSGYKAIGLQNRDAQPHARCFDFKLGQEHDGWLLEALVPVRRKEFVSELRYSKLVPVSGSPREELRVDPQDTKQLEDEACSLLKIEDGVYVVGLHDPQKGVARIRLLRMREQDGRVRLELSRNDVPFEAAFSLGDYIASNPVWAMQVRKQPVHHGRTATCNVTVGLGDGTIWDVRLEYGEDQFEGRPTRVGQLNAPVYSLLCTQSAGHCRIIAGAGNGAIVAWQELEPSPPAEALDDEPVSSRFAMVWATEESSSIVQLLELDSIDAIAAVTQGGRAVVFSDCPRVEELGAANAYHRLDVPGARHGRFKIGHGCFAAAALESPAGDVSPFRILIASGDGSVRRVGFHHPQFTEGRRKEYRELAGLWLSQITDGGRVRPHLLRKAESLLAATSIVPQVVVRWIFSSERWSTDGKDGQPNSAFQAWLPRYLRPLAELRDLLANVFPDNAELPDEARGSAEHPKHIARHLQAALRQAREFGDRELYEEIVGAILTWTNRKIFNQEVFDQQGKPDQLFVDSYKLILAEIETQNDLWLSVGADESTLVKMVTAKLLFDGEVNWRLAQRKSSVHAVRLKHAQRLLGAGDPTLSLETLRALNLAFIRTCARLRRDRNRKWHFETDFNLNWKSVRWFYSTLGDFVRSANASNAGLSEALAHEIIRSYALGILSCPDAVLEITGMIAEVGLPQGSMVRVQNQLELVSSLLDSPLPESLPTLFGHAAGIGPEPPEHLLQERLCDGDFGESNCTIAKLGEPFERLVANIRLLTEAFTREPSVKDLKIDEGVDMDFEVEGTQPRDDHFGHSRRFWSQAIRSYGEMLAKWQAQTGRCDDLEPATSSRQLMPDVVLISRWIAEWCKEQRVRLTRLYAQHEVFDPQKSRFERLLLRLEEVTRSFAESAVVQRSLVKGVLDHGLLERIDEHLLDLWEVAQVLDPLLTWQSNERSSKSPDVPADSEDSSTGSRFALYLLKRAQTAEGIPKALRVLNGLFEPDLPASSGGSLEQETYAFETLFDPYDPERSQGRREWNIQDLPKDARLTSDEVHLLGFALSELDSNDRIHGLGEAGHPPIIAVTDCTTDDECLIESLSLRFSFYYDIRASGDALGRVEEGLQQMSEPRDDREVSSYGIGLYIANLAASVAGWMLRIERKASDAEPPPSQDIGCLQFELSKFPSRTELP